MRAAVKRCGLYPRKSKDERTGRVSASVGEQEQTGRADCAEHGWEVADVYPDDARSASRFGKKTRDEWARLRSDVEAGRLDLVWLWESDRGGREVEDWAGFLNLCRRRGLLVYVHTHGRLYDPRVARDRRSLLEDGVDAEYESEKKSLSTRRALAANAANGKPHAPGHLRLPAPVRGRRVRPAPAGRPGRAPGARARGPRDLRSVGQGRPDQRRGAGPEHGRCPGAEGCGVAVGDDPGDRP